MLPDALQFPDDYDADACTWVPIPCALVPIVGGHLSRLQQRQEWETDEDWEQGYQAIVDLRRCLLNCGQSITTRLDAQAAALIALLTGNATTSADAMTALDIIASGIAAGNPSTEWDAAVALLTALHADGVGMRTNQVEEYTHATVEALAGTGVVEDPD